MNQTLPTRHQLRQRGFTLIELLTVITIIGILATIVTVGVQSAKKNASKAVTVTRFTTYIKAIKQYESDYAYFPQFKEEVPAGQDLVFGGPDTDWTDFWKTLYALDEPANWPSGEKKRLDPPEAKELGNSKRREYLEPSDENHYLDSSGDMDWTSIKGMDKKEGKEDIYLLIDLTGEAMVKNPYPKTNKTRPYLNTKVAFFALKSGKSPGDSDAKPLFQTW